jgi:hypothetical protein
MISRYALLLGVACGVFGGATFGLEALHIFAVRNDPVVTGHVVSRKPIRQYSVPRVDITIQLDDSEVQVHAHAQRYLMEQIPETVRFHFSSDPSREVFLLEHEENPYWIALFCWVCSIGLTACMFFKRIRRVLGWEQ